MFDAQKGGPRLSDSKSVANGAARYHSARAGEGKGVAMYDRRLDAVIASAELGSFSRAAERLHISTPALVKQVSGCEQEYGVTLFERSYLGVTPTAEGSAFVEEARAIVRRSCEALERVRGLGDGGSVRLGVSLMCPGRNTLELWPRVRQLEPGLKLEVVPIGDLYDARTSPMLRLGREVDVIQSSYSTVRWGGTCGLLPLFSSVFNLDVPRGSDLAKLPQVGFDRLRGRRIRVLRHGNDAMDVLRDALESEARATIVDVDAFDYALFNDAEARGDAVVTSGGWSGLHPGFVSVPLACEHRAPCFLAYPAHPTPQVRRFVAAMRKVLG